MSYFVVPKSFAGPGPGGIFVEILSDGSALSRILGQPTASCLHHWDIFWDTDGYSNTWDINCDNWDMRCI